MAASKHKVDTGADTAAHPDDWGLPPAAHSAPSGLGEGVVNDAGGTWGQPGSGTVGSGHGSKQHHPQDRNRGAETEPTTSAPRA